MKTKTLLASLLVASCSFHPGAGPGPASDHEHAQAHDHGDETAEMIEARSAILDAEGPSFNWQGLWSESERSCGDAFRIRVPAPSRKIVFTFDDGPDKLTPGLLDVLKRQKVKATFFVVGKMAAKGRAILARIQREGHIVASHSWSHPNFAKTDVAEQLRQIDSSEKEIGSFAKTPKLFRFPYGSGACEAWDHLERKKYGVVGWHADSCDWGFNKTGEVSDKAARICGVAPENRASFFNHVVDAVEKSQGGIVLFHDAFRDRTVPQIEGLIKEFKARGYRFSNLDDPEFRSAIWWKAP